MASYDVAITIHQSLPFGFQAEDRTLWQAPETYMAMSPFMHADRIKKPILLVHGEAWGC